MIATLLLRAIEGAALEERVAKLEEDMYERQRAKRES
jgi:hypothetical protein